MSLESGAVRFAARHPVSTTGSSSSGAGVTASSLVQAPIDPLSLLASGVARGRARFRAQGGDEVARQAIAKAIVIARDRGAVAQAEEARRRAMAAVEALGGRCKLEDAG